MNAAEIGHMQVKVREIIAEHLGRDQSEHPILDHHNFIDDLGGDSLDVTALVMAFEEEFGIEFTDKEADEIATVQGAVNEIQRKQEEQS